MRNAHNVNPEPASVSLQGGTVAPAPRILFFLAGWIFVSLGNAAGLIIPVSELMASGAVVHAQPRQLSPMLYSLDALLPIHAFRQEENWWPRAEGGRWTVWPPTALPWGYVLRLWLCFQILAGWVLTGINVTGLASQGSSAASESRWFQRRRSGVSGARGEPTPGF